MDPDFVDIGTPETKVIEECSEVIKVLCKVDRFGWYSRNPYNPELNGRDRVLSEIADLRNALDNLEEYIGINVPPDKLT